VVDLPVRRRAGLIGLTLTMAVGSLPAQDRLFPYRDPRLSPGERTTDLLARMTPREKFWQLYMSPGSLDDSTHDYSAGTFGLQIDVGADSAGSPARAHAERINRIQRFFVERTRLGIPIIPFEEALHGLAREGATVFPQAIALAATWDTALAGRVAAAAAREARTRGIRQVLSPVVNLASDVRWGRVEETYGEDPLLASVMARAFVREFEAAGIVTTPKHFVANVGEGGRDSYPIGLNRRELEEYDFPPFRAAIGAGARSIMTAYNSIDGTPATQNGWLLRQVLKREWRFPGFVISDAAATGGAVVLHHTAADVPTAAAQAWTAGLDVVFQSSWPQHRPYWRAVEEGRVAGAVIDSAVARVLRAKFSLGLFEHPFVNPDSAAWWNGRDSHRELAREAARASMVLLRNEGRVLPLSTQVGSIAVIGTDAAVVRLGGYSAPGGAPVSILDGLLARLPGTDRVRYEPGPGRLSPEVDGIPASALSADSGGVVRSGLLGEYFDNIGLSGTARLRRRDSTVDFSWTWNAPGTGIPGDWYSVRWTGRLTVPPAGVRRIGVAGNDGYRLWLDGRLIIDNWRKQSSRTTLADVELAPGRAYDIRLEFFESAGNARVKLVWDAGIPDPERLIRTAVTVTQRSDIAIVVAGIEEGEFRDRAMLRLPGRQEELIRAVAATGKPVVVVLVGGSAITMSAWIDQVDAVLMAWYPGEQGGHAVADVLLGDTSPAGRLPITFPVAEGQLPLRYNHKPTGRGDDYLDLTGQPLFPFGFGLSYTRFEYSALRVDSLVASDHPVSIRLTVRNAGERAGDEVVQLYLRDLLASVTRPVMQLHGFRRLHLLPGQEREITFTIQPDDLRLLDSRLQPVLEAGSWRVMVGASSRDIRLRGTFTLH
jgi:beta-glucosidase